MNIKEAHEVTSILDVHECTKKAANTYRLGIARGYMEAIEKAKILEKAIIEFAESRDCAYCNGFGCDDCIDVPVTSSVLFEALEEWEKEK